MTLKNRLLVVERQILIEVMEKHKGDVPRACKELGLSERMLWYKLKHHGLTIADFKDPKA